MSQYALWLTSLGESHDHLAQLIHQLSEQYRGPSFEPHITLLGGIQGDEPAMGEKVRKLGATLCPIATALQWPACEEEYFRCLYFPVKATPAILDAHEQAKVILGKSSDSPFSPHVSLLYGVFPIQIKQDIIATLPSDLPQQFLVSELKLIRVESLNPRDWHLVETISLQGPAG